jgi:hypothetical protein
MTGTKSCQNIGSNACATMADTGKQGHTKANSTHLDQLFSLKPNAVLVVQVHSGYAAQLRGLRVARCAALREQFSERLQNTRYWAQPRTLRA